MPELLVVIAIIGMLMAVLMPAVNAAREQGRATVCKSNLRQIALAALNHESAQGYLPSGGWGGANVGVPGRGFGRRQPGGWAFSLLGYLERNDLAEHGRDDPPALREAKVAQVLQTPISVFNCPTRRRAIAYPIFYPYARQPFGATPVVAVARSDYAANVGDQPRCEIGGWWGFATLEAGDDPAAAWPDVSDHTGVCFLRSTISLAQLRDGASRTLLFAEKAIPPNRYDDGSDHGDDWSMYAGYQDDGHRTTYIAPRLDGDMSHSCAFGSAHPATWNVSFADASVRGLSYDIDAMVRRSLGNRADGTIYGDNLIY